MVPKLTIHKQKIKVFAFFSVSLCLPLFSLTSPKTMLRYLKSNTMKCSEGTRRSNSSWLIWKKQRRPIVLSMQLRKQEKKQRPRQERKPKSKELQKRKRKRNGQSTFSNSGTRYWWKILFSWRALEVLRLQELNVRRLTQNIRRSNGLLKRLKRRNQKSTMRTPGLRQEVIIPVRDICMPDRIVQCITQSKQNYLFSFLFTNNFFFIAVLLYVPNALF